MTNSKKTALNKIFSRGNAVDQIDQVDVVATRVLKDRIANMGETESGAYGFYKVRADRGRLTVPLEIKVRDYILNNFEGIGSIHDIGGGIGTLALAFASYGVESVVIEYDPRRAAAGRAIRSGIMNEYKSVAKKLTIINEKFPCDETEAIKTSATLAVSTNIMGTLPKATQIQIIKGMSSYRAAIVDVQRFGAARQCPDEYSELVDSFLCNGFKTAEVGLDLGSEGLYYCFKP